MGGVSFVCAATATAVISLTSAWTGLTVSRNSAIDETIVREDMFAEAAAGDIVSAARGVQRAAQARSLIHSLQSGSFSAAVVHRCLHWLMSHGEAALIRKNAYVRSDTEMTVF